MDHPDLSEGHLAMIRAAVVSAPALAEVARGIRLGDSIRFGHGESTSGGSDKESILADALEAVIAAVHLDGGPVAAESLVRRLFGDRLVLAAVDPGIQDYKTRLQELAARESIPTPRYVLTDEGPDHDKRFHAVVEVAGGSHGPATGTSRKRAEQAAARMAFDAIAGTTPATDRTPSTTVDTPPTTSLEAT
jgi:ribonuclease-3